MLASQARDTSSILVSRTGRLAFHADVAQLATTYQLVFGLQFFYI